MATTRPSLPKLPSSTEAEHNLLNTLKTGIIEFPGTNQNYDLNASDLEEVSLLGSGSFGTVYKMFHRNSGRYVAAKRIRATNVDKRSQEQLVREHNIITSSRESPNIVKYYGAIFTEGDLMICMELMDLSLNHLYKYVYNIKKSRLEENLIGHITVCTLDALHYLKSLKIIHRDVKPSNILVNREGDVKLCDFGICGLLEDSYAKTHEAGCQTYLSPERISECRERYDVRSDVWAFGITLYEICVGEFPYKSWDSIFEMIETVVRGDAPNLNNKRFNFSKDLITFVHACLTKEKRERPKYLDLLTFNFYKNNAINGPARDLTKMALGKEVEEAMEHQPAP